MKKGFLKILSLMVVMLMMFAAVPSVFAAEELVVNSNATVNVGDTITYTVYLSDCEDPILGIQMYLLFDNDKLEYIKDSLEFGKFESVYYNENLDGYIPFSWTDVTNTADYSSKAVLFKADFNVIEGGEASVSDFISDMYGEDMTYMKNYTLTYDISVNGDNIGEEMPAPVTDDESFVADHQGDFINYSDGKGDNSKDSEEHQPVTQVVEKVVDVTKQISSTSSESSNNSTVTVLVIVAIIIVILAIVAVLIVKKKDDDINAASAANENNTEDNND
jgi:preprotein translocase subunit SecE